MCELFPSKFACLLYTFSARRFRHHCFHSYPVGVHVFNHDRREEESPEEEEEGHEEDIVPVSTPTPLPLAALPRLAVVEARALQLRHLLADAERVLEGALNKC